MNDTCRGAYFKGKCNFRLIIGKSSVDWKRNKLCIMRRQRYRSKCTCVLVLPSICMNVCKCVRVCACERGSEMIEILGGEKQFDSEDVTSIFIYERKVSFPVQT